MSDHNFNGNRRDFLRALNLTLAGGAAATLLPQFDLIGRALAASPTANAVTGYRALVCIFLLGGNDSFNMLIPHAQAEYDIYKASRGGIYSATTNSQGLAYDRNELSVITDDAGKSWGLNPNNAALKPLFDAGELGFIANIGSLVEPVTKDQVIAKSKPLPFALYSHNDQQRQWMRGHSLQSNGGLGWGGFAGDALRSANTGLVSLPPTISVAGANLFQMGKSVLPYVLSSSTGPVVLNKFRSDTNSNKDKIRNEALAALMRTRYTQVMSDQYALTGDNAMVVNDALRRALDPANGGDIATQFTPATNLGSQLRMIARMIKASRTSAIGHQRQIYFASMGGFDTHDNQMVDTGHPKLMRELSAAMATFRDALKEINSFNDVTTFTMSDFGRTLNSNGNGTDHAWGGVQMVMGGAAANGGALRGRKIWGTYPLLELDGPQAVNRGRMVPTTSVQQMGSTLAAWLGVDAAQMETIFPGVGKFPGLPFLG